MNSRPYAIQIAIALATSVACSNGDSSSNSAVSSAAVASDAIAKTQPADANPCAWITQAEVEAVTGALDRPPFRNHGDEAIKPDPQGTTCAYVVPSANKSTIPSGFYLEVATHDGTQFLAGVQAGLRAIEGWLPPGHNAGDTGVAGPWDEAAGSGKRLFTARQGDAGVMLTGLGWGLPKEQLGTLAERVLAKIPDIPTAAPEKRGDAEEESPQNPCSLITQTEAEKVLGKLSVAPYRSRTSTSMYEVDGGSCSYRTPKHRVLVLSPTWTGGQMQLKLAAFSAQQTAKVLGGSAEADTLEGPWDQVAGGASGEIYFLKGDALLTVQYKSSSTDVGGAVAIARQALGRF